jgi:hypothetical protein
MNISTTAIVERIARVLAGQRLSANANGTQASAAGIIDQRWHEYVDDALAVLRTMREPDPAMAEAGDPAAWERMIRVALNEERP